MYALKNSIINSRPAIKSPLKMVQVIGWMPLLKVFSWNYFSDAESCYRLMYSNEIQPINETIYSTNKTKKNLKEKRKKALQWKIQWRLISILRLPHVYATTCTLVWQIYYIVVVVVVVVDSYIGRLWCYYHSYSSCY